VASPLTVAIVGHSQGGHAAYAAEAFAPKYGAAGKLVAIASFAPFWTSMSAWGAIVTPIAGFTTKGTPDPILFAMWYWYAAGELRDGPGGGLAMFDASKRAQVKTTLLSPQCYDYPNLQLLGSTPNDFFDPTFANDVGNSCGAFGTCTTPAAMLWKSRWLADRPALDPNGPPMLTWYAAMDLDVPPNLAQCALDRLAADGTPASLVSYCFDAGADHNNVIRRNSDYVNQWIAARAGLGKDPAPCTPFPAGMQACRMPPANF
jgi:pimeloyl-ACP methyl ester carboxylesterase